MPFIWDAWEPHSMSNDRTEFVTLKFCTGLRWKVCKPPNCEHSSEWSGHVHHMNDCRLPKKLFSRELKSRKYRTKKNYEDSLKESLKCCNIPDSTWKETMEDHASWRSVVSSRLAAFKRGTWLKTNRNARRAKTVQVLPPSPAQPPAFYVLTVTDFFWAKIGLNPHLKPQANDESYLMTIPCSKHCTWKASSVVWKWNSWKMRAVYTRTPDS